MDMRDGAKRMETAASSIDRSLIGSSAPPAATKRPTAASSRPPHRATNTCRGRIRRAEHLTAPDRSRSWGVISAVIRSAGMAPGGVHSTMSTPAA